MKWLTLEEIKQQCRIEQSFTDEDAILTRYGNSAENTVLQICHRTYDDFIREYGEIPADVVEASLLLVTNSYEHRSPASQYNMYAIGYAFDMKIKPYMRLVSDTDDEVEDYVATLGDDVKVKITVDLPDGMRMQDVPFTVTVININEKNKTKVYDKAECLLADDGSYVVLVDSTLLGIGRYMARVLFRIPDADYESGYRKQVANINPHLVVRG